MTSTDLQTLLTEIYTERVLLLMRHEASATVMGDYDINNTYQYVLSREETHVSWLHHAIVDVGGRTPPDPARPLLPERVKVREVSAEDARLNQAFVDKWRPRVEAMTQARHKALLEVVLGEMLEHKRFFEQAADGRSDLLGLPMAIHPRVGQVLGKRWVE